MAIKSYFSYFCIFFYEKIAIFNNNISTEIDKTCSSLPKRRNSWILNALTNGISHLLMSRPLINYHSYWSCIFFRQISVIKILRCWVWEKKYAIFLNCFLFLLSVYTGNILRVCYDRLINNSFIVVIKKCSLRCVKLI